MEIVGKSRMYLLGLLVLLVAPSMAFAGGTSQQADDLKSFADGEPVVGGGTLNRDDDSVLLRVALDGLEPHAVYSAWWIVFNRPHLCTGGGPGVCMGSDLENPAVRGAVINAGGFIASGWGTGYFMGELEAGSTPYGACCFGRLASSKRAEIHIVIQNHGPGVAGTVAEHMTQPIGIDTYFLVYLAVPD